MSYRKLTFIRFLMFCASLYFGAVQVEALRFDDAKLQVRNFLSYLLPELGYNEADFSFVDNAQNLNDLAIIASQYTPDALLDELDNILNNNELVDKAAEIRATYTDYQIAYINIIEEEQWARNTEIPLAYTLAERLCLGRREFNLNLAKTRVNAMLRFLRNLIGYRTTNVTVIDTAFDLEALTTRANDYLSRGDLNNLRGIARGDGQDPNIPSRMQERFNAYLNGFVNLLVRDPLTRGKEIPLAEDIGTVSAVWQE